MRACSRPPPLSPSMMVFVALAHVGKIDSQPWHHDRSRADFRRWRKADSRAAEVDVTLDRRFFVRATISGLARTRLV